MIQLGGIYSIPGRAVLPHSPDLGGSQRVCSFAASLNQEPQRPAARLAAEKITAARQRSLHGLSR